MVLLLAGRSKDETAVESWRRGYSVAARCLNGGWSDMQGGSAAVGELYLCSEDVWDERPPKEDAMVLNSTCLICNPSLSWWTM